MYFLQSNHVFLPGNLALLEKAKVAKSRIKQHGANISKLDFFCVSLENVLKNFSNVLKMF